MRFRATTVPILVFISLVGAAIAVPALRTFLGGLGWSLLAGTIGLRIFLAPRKLSPACRPDEVQIRPAPGRGDRQIRLLVIASTPHPAPAGRLAEM